VVFPPCQDDQSAGASGVGFLYAGPTAHPASIALKNNGLMRNQAVPKGDSAAAECFGEGIGIRRAPSGETVTEQPAGQRQGDRGDDEQGDDVAYDRAETVAFQVHPMH
jgi:hypothetical protein